MDGDDAAAAGARPPRRRRPGCSGRSTARASSSPAPVSHVTNLHVANQVGAEVAPGQPAQRRRRPARRSAGPTPVNCPPAPGPRPGSCGVEGLPEPLRRHGFRHDQASLAAAVLTYRTARRRPRLRPRRRGTARPATRPGRPPRPRPPGPASLIPILHFVRLVDRRRLAADHEQAVDAAAHRRGQPQHLHRVHAVRLDGGRRRSGAGSPTSGSRTYSVPGGPPRGAASTRMTVS